MLGSTLSIYKRWNNISLQLLTDVQKCKWNSSSKRKAVNQSCVPKCIWQIFLFKAHCSFKGALAAIFEWYHHYWNKHSQVISFFKGIELIRNSSCSHPFEEYSKMKEQMQPRILSNLLCFCRTGIEHVHIERSLLFDDISCSHPFFLW